MLDGFSVTSSVRRGARRLGRLPPRIAAPRHRPEYVLRHLGVHLHGDDVALDRLAPVLSRRWADAWLDLEGHHAGFIAGAAQVIDRARGRYQRAEDPDERSHAFLLAIEAIVARASAISLAEAIPTELLPLLLAVTHARCIAARSRGPDP